MRIAGRIFCVAFVCLAAQVPSALAIDIILESLSATTHPQILDGTFTFDAEPPAFDPNSAGLLSILNSIAADFEDVFEDAATIRITYWWDSDMTFCCGQSIPAMMREDGNGNLTHSIVRINPTVAYYIDPTPTVDSEYTMAQRLYSFGPNAITPAQQTARFTGNVPAVFEAGYNGLVVPGGPADGGLRDLLTLAYQEMGHSIGMNAGFTGLTNGSNTGEIDDGDYDVNPAFVNGNIMAMLPRGTSPDPLDHLVGVDAVMASLSTSTERTRPSTADYLAIAASQGWTEIDLPRKDFLGGLDWHTDSNWLGGLRALSLDHAYVRHGGAATLSGIGNVRTLTIDNDSSVQTSIHQLVADFVTIQSTVGGGTPRILVSEFGELTSEIVNVGDGTRLDVFGGFAEIERLNIQPGGELRGNGTVDINDIIGQLTNDGIIRASGAGTLLITSDNNLGIDLDGAGENGEVFATAGDLNIQTALTDPFNDQMTIGSGRQVTFGGGGSIGSGGLVLLDGGADAATVGGSVLFVNPGGVIRADGLGVVQNALFLGDGAYAETEDAASEIRLNGTTYLNGGRIVGPGTARQNGQLFVGHDSEVEIPTYDLDGQSGNTVITVSPAVEFVILSPAIDTVPENDFDGTFHVNNSTLEIAPAWRLDGVLNLNGANEGGGGHDDHDDGGSEEPNNGAAVLRGAGGVTVDMNGTINVTGTASVETSVGVNNGLVFVDGDATFSGPTILGVNADVEINHADDTLRLMGNTILIGPSIVGSGRLLFDGSVNIAFFDTTIGVAETDLDGLLGNTQILINSGLTFSIASITTEPSANDGFDGVITNHGTFSVLAGWRLDGDLEMEQIGAATTLAGVGPFRIHNTGTFSTDGDAIVTAPTQVAGAMLIDNGLTQINNSISFESTAFVIVQGDAELELNGATTFAGGSYTGQGLIQFNALTNVNANTTVGTGRVDLDGAAENTHIVLNNSALVLNVAGIDTANSLFAGTIDVTDSAARLEVNLTNPLNVWRLSPAGILNFSTASLVPVTMLAGSTRLVSEGTINATGRARFTANVSILADLTTTSVSTDVHFGSVGQNYIYNTADVTGPGAMTVDNGSRMHFEDNTLIGIDVENAGRLEVGFVTNELGIDHSAPGHATIRSTFAQTGTGTFAVNLGGHIQGDEYDLLTVTEEARLGGTLEVSLIDGFVPTVGDLFQILTASPRVNTFTNVVTLDTENLYGMDVSVLYSATDVVVRINEVFLLGDYNRNGHVDSADYTIWRNTLDQMGDDLPADGNGDKKITRLDFDVWKSHFGQPFGSGAISGEKLSPAVPEPASLVLLSLALATLLLTSRGRCKGLRCSQNSLPLVR